MQSKRFTLSKQDLSAIGRGALVAIGGALITYLIDILPQVNFGEMWTPIIVAVASILLNAARKYLAGK